MKKFLLAAVAMVAAGSAMAGTGATGNAADFQSALTMLTDWSTGTLGAVISVAVVLVGLGIGILRQSVIAVVAGIAAAIVLSQGPTILTAMFTTAAF